MVGSLGGDADGLVGSHLHPGVRRGRGDGGSLEPEASYGVVCSAQFSGGWSVSDSTPVEGTPPAEAPGMVVLAAESDREESVHDREGRQRDRQRGGELRPGGQPRQLLPQRSEQDPGLASTRSIRRATG